MSGASSPELRAEGYRLLSRVILNGVGEETLSWMRRVPDFETHLGERVDLDLLAAEHHRLLGSELLPFASVFLEGRATLGGVVTTAMEGWRSRARLPGPVSEAADHLGRELEVLAELTGGREEGAVLELLDGHLLWWLPSFLVGMERNADPLWSSVAELLGAAVFDHRRALAGDAPARFPPPPGLASAEEVPGVPSPRGGRDTAIGAHTPRPGGGSPDRELAALLVSPLGSGLYLGEEDARRLARSLSLPGGFGGRRRVWATVLNSARSYGALEPFADGVLGYIRVARARLEGWVDAEGLPLDFVRPWISRLERSVLALEELKRDPLRVGGA